MTMSSPSDSESELAEPCAIGDNVVFSRKSSSGRRMMRNPSFSFTTADEEQVVRSGKRMIYTSGRPPWYDSSGQLKEAFVIGISGGSASGKTSVAKMVIEALDIPWVSLLCMDSFYKVLSAEELQLANECNYNFDVPEAFNLELIATTMKRLREGKNAEIPIYNFTTHQVDKKKKTIYGANVVIFEGIFAFQKELLPYMDCKVFVDTDSDVRLARRLRRDILERGRDVKGVLKQYMRFVKPAYDTYIDTTKNVADIIVPRGGENVIGVNLIVNLVHQRMHERGFQFRSILRQSLHQTDCLPASLHVLERTNQVVGLHTFIRNRETCRDEFIFYSKRLMRMLIEFALSLLPFKEVIVNTPQTKQYQGLQINASNICGVSILRAGETMEPALCDVCHDVSIGKILIQTNNDTGEPELHYLRLPRNIKDSHIILMDATMATGAAAMMAIRVLLDHDVKEENILLASLIMALPGIYAVAYAFPGVKLVTTEVDKEINDAFHILPGIGNFGDRYFGTEPI